MNFKKTYTEANNQIHGDRSKIDTIFEIAEKKRNPHSVYQICTAACAAAVIIGVYITGLAPGNTAKPKGNVAAVKQTVTENVKGNETAESANDVTEKKADIAMSDTKPTEEKTNAAPTEKQSEKNTAENDTPKNETGILPKSDSDISKSESAADESAQISMFSELGAKMAVADEDESGNETLRSGVAFAYDAQGKCNFLDGDEYAKYLGSDVIKKAVLPEDMSFDEFFGASVLKDSDSGEVTYDMACYNAYTSAETYTKHIDIYTSRIEYASLPETDGAEKPKIEKFNAGGVYYTVCAYGTDNFELDALIKSLKQ